ncbi:MAG: hypothetical protein K8R35_11045, partial [Bacteroidales bacterium]|nr:hypothetical protein [Bacteroidales bacterium]
MECTITKKTKIFECIEISSDFESGSCGGVTKVGGDAFFIRIFKDPSGNHKLEKIVAGYSWYFCIKIINETDSPKKILLFAGTEPTGMKEGFNKSSARLFASADFDEWSLLPNVLENDSGVYQVELELQPNKIYYISNSLPRPYSVISNWLREIADKNGDICHLVSIGKSVQGRDIFLLSITENSSDKRDRILVTSGFHPAEPDTLATEAIIKFLTSGDETAQEIRKKFVVDIISQTNPDGFVLGTNGCNANGINLYWDFRPHDRENTPESYYLWRFIENNTPLLYIDYHCYVHQCFKEACPYLKSLLYYDGVHVRRLVRQTDQYLLDLCQSNA